MSETGKSAILSSFEKINHHLLNVLESYSNFDHILTQNACKSDWNISKVLKDEIKNEKSITEFVIAQSSLKSPQTYTIFSGIQSYFG